MCLECNNKHLYWRTSEGDFSSQLLLFIDIVTPDTPTSTRLSFPNPAIWGFPQHETGRNQKPAQASCTDRTRQLRNMDERGL